MVNVTHYHHTDYTYFLEVSFKLCYGYDFWCVFQEFEKPKKVVANTQKGNRTEASTSTMSNTPVAHLTDVELAEELKSLGFVPGPIIGMCMGSKLCSVIEGPGPFVFLFDRSHIKVQYQHWKFNLQLCYYIEKKYNPGKNDRSMISIRLTV